MIPVADSSGQAKCSAPQTDPKSNATGGFVSAINGAEIELSLGSFDSPGVITPQYESWTVRREPWLTPLHAPQYSHDRAASK
jgi:hypothetical protein